MPNTGIRDRAEDHRRGREAAHEEALLRIQNGEYAKDFVLENRAGAPRPPQPAAHDRRAADREGRRALREMMPWIRKNRLVDTSKN